MNSVKNKEIENEKLITEDNRNKKRTVKEYAKSIYKNVILLLRDNMIFVIGIVLLVCKSILLNKLLGLELGFKPIMYMIAASSLIMCPIINKKNKFAYIYLNIVYTLATLLIYFDYIYWSYSNNFLSLYQLVNLQYAKEIGSGLMVLINIKNLLTFWITNLLVAICSIIVYKKTHNSKKTHDGKDSKTIVKAELDSANQANLKSKVSFTVSSNSTGNPNNTSSSNSTENPNNTSSSNSTENSNNISSLKSKLFKTVLIVLIVVINVIVVTKNINGIYKDKQYNKSLIVQNASIYYYHYEDVKDYISSLFFKEDVDTDKLAEIYNSNVLSKTNGPQYTGIAQNKNVIILQLESLNKYIINKSVNGKEIMPNLNKFYRENIYCEDMYNQGLGTTADSEFEMENSMYPLENGYVFQKYYNNTWLDIYSTLKKQGYYTSFMHPNTSTFWNRREVYNTGYKIDEYDDINDFPEIERAGEFHSDEGFLKEAVKKMNSYEGNFCTTLVSVTTHIPFYLTGVSDLENKLTFTEDDVKEYEDETFRNYLISCNFVDYAFGEFIKELKETGLYDNSIIVVYGDHGSGMSVDDIQKLYEENGEEYNSFEQATKDVHIPFGLSIPNFNDSLRIKRAVSKIDIKPTILDLLGVQDTFSLGKSIFSDKDYSFIKGLGYVTSKDYCFNDICYNRKTMQEIEKDERANKLIEKMENEIYLSDTIIKNNLLAKQNDK